MSNIRMLLGLSLAALPLAGPAQSAAQGTAQPRLTREQSIQLFEAAGFRVENGRAINRCGGASNPRVAFADLNGDGRAEAHVADVDPKCYGMPGAYFAVLTLGTDGRWRSLIAEDGIVGFAKTRTGGWRDLTLEARYSACPGTRHFAGGSYGAPTACSQDGKAAAAPASAAPPRSGPMPISRDYLFDWDGSQTPEAKALPATERLALFRAAEIKPVKGGRWTACTDDDSGHSEAQVDFIGDVNGDGRPEAMIHDNGIFCNGSAGVNSIVLTKTPAGSWKVMLTTQGFANFLKSHGVDNYPDIQVGLPGFCFPYLRWNGREYDLAARFDDNGKPCKPF